MSSPRNKKAVLLLAHGTASTVADIPAYLGKVFGGRPVPEPVIAEVTHRYQEIGGSPLTKITLAQGRALEQRISRPVYVGMRNWHPFISDVIAKMISDGMDRVTAICLAPQNSRTSVGLYKNAVLTAAGDNLKVEFIESWHDQPKLITAFADKLRAARAQDGTNVPVIFTAHSVPTRTIEGGDPYEQQARETAALVAKANGLASGEWRFAFQSQGMSGGPWIGPTVEDTITTLQVEGHERVLIQPIGFLCDHVEVLYDIDVAFKQFAADRGVELTRTESLNDSPLLIEALAELVAK